MKIKVDDLAGGEVVALLDEHLSDMYATSPRESVHALDLNALKDPSVTFFSSWDCEHLAGCIAIKQLTKTSAEIKSMRTVRAYRGQGVASELLLHTIAFAKQQGYQHINLETGTQSYFDAARRLYKKHGFIDSQPFADYKHDPNSCFMTRSL